MVPGRLWTSVEGIQNLREIDMLVWICELRPIHASWESPEDMPFTYTVRNKYMKRAPGSFFLFLFFLKSIMFTLLKSLDFTMGTVVTKLGNLNSVGLSRFWGMCGRWGAGVGIQPTKGKEGMVTGMKSRIKQGSEYSDSCKCMTLTS